MCLSVCLSLCLSAQKLLIQHTTGVKHSDFCCFKGVTYVTLTLCFKLISFCIVHCDYCNVLFAGFPASQLARLQSVLKAAARLVLGISGCASVTARCTTHYTGSAIHSE